MFTFNNALKVSLVVLAVTSIITTTSNKANASVEADVKIQKLESQQKFYNKQPLKVQKAYYKKIEAIKDLEIERLNLLEKAVLKQIDIYNEAKDPTGSKLNSLILKKNKIEKEMIKYSYCNA